MATKPKTALKQPAQRVRAVRLDSVKNPQPRPVPKAVLQASAQSRRPSTLQCTNKQCPQSDIDEDDGKLVCKTCGVVVQDGQITSEIQFLDMANGSVAVSGSYVGANEEHARNSALGNSKIAGGMDSRQVSLRNGNNAIRQIADGLSLGDTHKSRALSIYTLATGINFIQGREINHVAAACLYIACRMESQNRMMLIDFSDALQINVFKLGQTYLTLVEDLGLREKKGIGELNPEGLIYRFAEELEFGSDKTKVAEEAVRILKRMDRDWMTPGRRPAGVCGAAIILAARMNNYRRTVRELVYIAKVTDITIAKRLEEFKYTDSSKLTVTEFLNHGDKVENNCDPPAYYKQFLPPKKKRRKQKDNGTAEDEMSDTETERAISVTSSRSDSRQDTPTSKEQLDSQAMPPPPIPVDPALLEVPAQRLPEVESTTMGDIDENGPNEGESVAAGQKRKRGRPSGTKNKPPPTPSSSQILEETDMESEINSFLEDPETISNATALHQELHRTMPNSPPATQQDTQQDAQQDTQHDNSVNDAVPDSQDQEPGAVTVLSNQSEEVLESTEPNNMSPARETAKVDKRTRTTSELLATVPDSEVIPEDEFADDPEVNGCLLDEAERAIKERIWVHDNADYLRAQQAKLIKKQLAEANGTTRVIVRRKRKRGRMGDMSAYQRTTEDGQVTGPQTPEEAVAAMLAKRAYSKKINYQAIHHLLGSEASSESGSTSRVGSVAETPARESGSRASTPKVTVTSPTPPRPVAKGTEPIHVEANDEDEEEEEEEEEAGELLGAMPEIRKAFGQEEAGAAFGAGDEEDEGDDGEDEIESVVEDYDDWIAPEAEDDDAYD
ncbi:transcription factor TFIIIB subunit brf1 [Xylographa opegraphella]|nr:transcription factor TFIIIB subunit brf1 [Xylographa opegraphella]